LFFITISKFKTKIKNNDIKLIFLFFVTISPVLLTFLTSLLLGIKIRTMWMKPFYLFLGIFFIYVYKEKIMLVKMKNFISFFLILFLLAPLSYLYISIIQKEKRTDYPGKQVSEIVQKKWNTNFKNEIGLVSGDEWYAGNLSYHLKSRPKWDDISEHKKTKKIDNFNGGFVIILDDDKDNLKTLLKICTGVFFKVDNQGVCMIGEKK